MPCEYCGAPDTIKSHVVPDFIIRYLRDNSVRRGFFHSWSRGEFQNWMITGPYFCAHCDNAMIGGWESHFSQDVFPDPLAATDQWGLETSVRFIVSICYRYAINSLRVDPNPAHQPIGMLFRDLCKTALDDPTQVGQTLFVYPYIYRPITARCDLKVRINHFLALCGGDRFRLPADGLPNRYLIQLPRMLFLFSEANLTATGLPDYVDLVDLQLHTVFDPVTANLQIPGLHAELLNEGVQLTMNHQTASNLWWHYWDTIDERSHPNKAVYRARTADSELRAWQNANC